MKKKIGILIILCLLLVGEIFLYKKVRPSTEENIIVTTINYEQIFNAFTGTIMVRDKYDLGQKVTKNKLSDNEKLEIIKALVDKNDYTDSKEKA